MLSKRTIYFLGVQGAGSWREGVVCRCVCHGGPVEVEATQRLGGRTSIAQRRRGARQRSKKDGPTLSRAVHISHRIHEIRTRRFVLSCFPSLSRFPSLPAASFCYSTFALMYSRFSLAICDTEISFGHSASQAYVLEHAPNPSASIWAIMRSTRSCRSV